MGGIRADAGRSLHCQSCCTDSCPARRTVGSTLVTTNLFLNLVGLEVRGSGALDQWSPKWPRGRITVCPGSMCISCDFFLTVLSNKKIFIYIYLGVTPLSLASLIYIERGCGWAGTQVILGICGCACSRGLFGAVSILFAFLQPEVAQCHFGSSAAPTQFATACESESLC